MNRRKLIHKPFVLKLELVKGCNLRCKFCPVNTHTEYQDPKLREPIDLELVEQVCRGVERINPSVRVELTGRGEPTLHPDVLKCVSIMRAAMPLAQISMFTNGVMILKDHGLMIKLIEVGCNILNIDCYNNTYDRFKKIAEEEMPKGVELRDFRKFSAYKKYGNGHKLRVINLVPDIQDPAHLVSVREVHNMAGNLSTDQMKMFDLNPLKKPLEKMCTRPFREYQIHSNGVVSICCHDWGEENVLGTIKKAKDVEDIWYGKDHLNILRALFKRNRNFDPCNKCDFWGGFRVGIVRNPFTGYDPYQH